MGSKGLKHTLFMLILAHKREGGSAFQLLVELRRAGASDYPKCEIALATL